MKKKDLLLLIIFVGILGFTIRVSAADVSCNGVFGDELISTIKDNVFTPIKYITPALLLVLTAIDFAGVVFSGDKKNMDKAKNNFLKRAVAALIIFFAPDIIVLLAKFVDQQSISSCLNNMKMGS